MLRFEVLKELARRPCLSLLHVIQPLPNSFYGVCLSRDVQQALVGFWILHHRRGLSK